MGNLIKDFWTYTNRNGSQYYGFLEVVRGEDLGNCRSVKKLETHIEKALDYVMTPGWRVPSHMGLQTYITFLKDEVKRSEDEQAYYPFVMEFESRYTYEYSKAVQEALRVSWYLIHERGLNEQDLLIMITNNRSIYLFVNPKVYDLRPTNRLHEVYKNMYKLLKEEIGLEYVDTSIYSHNKLIKTPNSYHKGGFFVRISLEELKELARDPFLKSKLTAEKRSLNIEVPGESAPGIVKLYEDAKEMAWEGRKVEKEVTKSTHLTYIKSSGCKCVEYMEKNVIEEGCRNHALVSMAIYYRDQGYTMEQVLEKLREMARDWGHTESDSTLKSKVKWAFTYKKRFSCEKARDVLTSMDMKNLCSRCPYNLKSSFRANTIEISSQVINELWVSGASTRHFVAYLELSKKDLLNKWFTPEQAGMNDRTIRELCNHSRSFSRTREKGQVYISFAPEGNKYYVPKRFIENGVHHLLGDYLKHYLMLLIKGYKPANTYLLLRVSKEKLQKDLGYSDLSGVYKLLSRLKEIGLIIVKSNHVMCLYYESFKIKDIQDYRTSQGQESTKKAEQEKESLIVNGGSPGKGYPRRRDQRNKNGPSP